MEISKLPFKVNGKNIGNEAFHKEVAFWAV
jgi:hypothetical protein